MTTTRHFYRFSTSSELGKKFRSFWNECNKAERAAEVFAGKVGAAAYYSSPSAFAGGVACVAFEPGKANEKMWRSAGKTDDGEELWEPDVKQRNGVLVLPRRGFRPSDTATRIYSKRISAWKDVKGILSMREWAAMARVEMPATFATGEPCGPDVKTSGTVAASGTAAAAGTVAAAGAKLTEAQKAARKHALAIVEKKIDEKMEKEMFCQYIELYRDDDIPADPTHPHRKKPLYISQSIRIEKERLTLPVVSMDMLYHLMQADLSGDKPEDDKPKVIENVTPTFFEWGGRYYIGIEYPCKAEGLETIMEGVYQMKLSTMKAAERISDED